MTNSSQHGYTKDKLCLTNLLLFIYKVYKATDRDENYVYLDLFEGFDKVSHKGLSSIVKAHGIKSKVVKWIKMWLSETCRNLKEMKNQNGLVGSTSTFETKWVQV